MFATPGFLACQQNSFLKSLATTVVQCQRRATSAVYDVVLKDTILFPEGGGQPDDRGTINGIPVTRVYAKGGVCYHEIEQPLDVDTQVQLELDWKRRFDHMQHHSGQHLISAIALKKWGYETVSWELSDKRCNVEFSAKSIPTSHLNELEENVNEAILSSIPVEIGYMSTEDLDGTLEGSESHKIARFITIGSMDKNKCCGTHVQNTSQLQCVKFYHTENVRGGCTRVYFSVGQRVLRDLKESHERETKITKLLSSAPDDFASRVEKLLSTQRDAAKNMRSLQKEIAEIVAEGVLSRVQGQGEDLDPKQRFVSIHRSNGDSSYLQNAAACVAHMKERMLFLLSVGSSAENGMFLLFGPDSVVDCVSPKVLELLDGKGGGKKGKFQAKFKSLHRIDEAKAYLQQYVEDNQNGFYP